MTDYGIQAVQYFRRWYAEDDDAARCQRGIPAFVAERSIAATMRLAIDLDGKPASRAIEVEHVRGARMLAAELVTGGTSAQHLPEQDLGQRHRAAEGAGTLYRR